MDVFGSYSNMYVSRLQDEIHPSAISCAIAPLPLAAQLSVTKVPQLLPLI